MAEREQISRGVAAGEPCRQIAARLGRAPSTVSRELARNGGRHRSRAQAADAAAFRRAQRPKPAKLAVELGLRAVEEKLAVRWSPEQIAGWLPLAYPSDPVMGVSHETIYLSLFVQTRGALRRELQRCLRTGRAMRSPRGKRLPQGRGQLRDTLQISQRPPEAADRAVPGHWEGDLVLGKRPSAVGDLGRAPQPLCGAVPAAGRVHRRARAAGPDRCCPPAAAAAAPLADLGSWQGDGPAHPVHRRLGRAGLLLRPTQPWQRGTNENTNGLLRHYLSKSSDLRQLDQATLDAIAAELNGRPRQTLGFKTPSQALAEALH